MLNGVTVGCLGYLSLIESIDSHVTDISSASTGRPTCTHQSNGNVLYSESGKEWMDSDAIVGP
jgi:hypothetical protein